MAKAVHRNITYRLLPLTAARGRRLASAAGACRYVWNTLLDDQQALYDCARMCGGQPPSPSCFTLCKAFTQLRRTTPWLAGLPFTPLRHCLKYQAEAWQRIFRGTGGRPRCKARRGTDSITIPGNVRIEGGRLWFPKIGWLALRRRGGNPYPDGIPKQAGIKRVNGRWQCTVCYAVALERRPDDGLALGVNGIERGLGGDDVRYCGFCTPAKLRSTGDERCHLINGDHEGLARPARTGIRHFRVLTDAAKLILFGPVKS